MFATELQVEFFKARHDVWERSGFKNADPRMPEVTKLFNQLPHIAPVWSCEGHAAEEMHDDHDRIRAKRWDTFYVMVVSTEDGWPTLVRIYQDLQARLLSRQLAHEASWANTLTVAETAHPPHSELSKYRMAFVNRLMPLREAADWYNAVNFSGDTTTRVAKEVFFQDLLATLHKVVGRVTA